MEISKKRETTETRITLFLDFSARPKGTIKTDLPFFTHMLNAMSFHGGFYLALDASGDIEVDPHHLVEDCGLVLGDAINEEMGRIVDPVRFADVTVPMDDALVQAVIDLSGRSWLGYAIEFQKDPIAGDFTLSLLREFFVALVANGRFNLHITAIHGENGHHLAEATFKSVGMALGRAIRSRGDTVTPSTKGVL